MTIPRLVPPLVLAVGLGLAPCRAAAGPLEGGAIELSPRVSFSHSNLKREGYGNVDRFTRFDFAPTVGFCLTRHYQVTGGLLMRHESVNDSRDTSLGVLTGLTYNFSPQGGIIPFAAIGFGTLFYGGFSFDNTAVLFPSITGGFRVMVGSAASMNVSLGYERESDSHARSNRLVAGVGVSLFPWSAR